jgi:hypothetical protein
LFEIELTPSLKRPVTAKYIVECIFDHEKYSLAEIISTSREGITNKQRNDWSQECGKSHLNKAQDCYLCGITNRLILEHALDGGEGADPTTKEGKRFTNMYGVPWPLFNDLSQEFESWCSDHDHHFHCTNLSPFKLRLVACFRQLRTYGSLTQFCDSRIIVRSVFNKYFYLLLDWHWDIRDKHIKMPETKKKLTMLKIFTI